MKNNPLIIMFYVILIILILDFVWTQYLAHRNRKCMSFSIPTFLEGIYDKDKYYKQQNYQLENSKFELLSSFLSFIIIICIIFFKGFGRLDTYVQSLIINPVLKSLIFLSILFIANIILTLPLSYYQTFVIEKRYGFNKMTNKLFWLDWIKNFLIGIVLGGIILYILIWFYNSLGASAWLYAWGFITIFSLFMTLFYSNIIVPLFNKQTPLQDGELKDSIHDFCEKANFGLDNIYVIDASKRSTKANAYFTGLGANKRIVLYDTLINDLSTNEIVAVLAHEIGHYKKKHIIKHLIFSILYSGVLLFILSFFLNNLKLSEALGSNIPSFHLGIITFSILFSPISLLLKVLINLSSRRNEYEADAFAAQFGLSDNLINGLKKLSVNSLSNLNPDPLNVFIYYSHPTLLQRIDKLTK